MRVHNIIKNALKYIVYTTSNEPLARNQGGGNRLSSVNGRLCVTNIVDLDVLLGKKIIAKYQLWLKQFNYPSVKTHWNETHHSVYKLFNSPINLQLYFIEFISSRGTHLQALLFTSFSFLVVGVLAPVAVAVRIVRQERVVRFTSCLHIALDKFSQLFIILE